MSTLLFDLTGRTALVTGGTHGLGMAIATGLAEAGAKIIVNDIFPEKLEAARKEFAEKGISIQPYVLDVTDEEAVDRTIPEMEREAGPIDILVNNAGIIKRIPILEMRADQFRQVVDVDLTGPFIVSKAVAKGMAERGGGKIINMCSMMSELGRDTVSAYAAAKGGLKMLTRSMGQIQSPGQWYRAGLFCHCPDGPDQGGRASLQRFHHQQDPRGPLGRT
jgi:gluconate 5-dehydrogenase